MPESVESGGQPSPQENADYMVALLALWAGDDEGARDRLRAITKGLSHTPRAALFVEHPVLASALRTLDQLNRRKTEYATLLDVAGLKSTDRAARMCVRKSKGGHLNGVISTDSDRRYQFRVYLSDLAWEHVFYERAFRRTQKAPTANSPSLYMKREGESRDSLDTKSGRELSLAWVEPGELFIEVDVSDFCTLEATGVWTRAELPRDPDEIISPFQHLLDSLDPSEEPTRKWPEEGF